MMEISDLIKLVGEVLGIIVILTIETYILPKLRAFLEAKRSLNNSQELETLVDGFVRGAEQTIKKSEDSSGAKRNAYVRERLQKLGYEINDVILALIEGKVQVLNAEQKKEQN